MKRIVFILAAILVLQGVLLAQVVEPQPEWLTQRVTVRGARLTDILADIEEIGGFTLKINPDDEKRLEQSFDLKFTGATIKDVLQFVLGRAGLSYKIVDAKAVHVFKRTTP